MEGLIINGKAPANTPPSEPAAKPKVIISKPDSTNKVKPDPTNKAMANGRIPFVETDGSPQVDLELGLKLGGNNQKIDDNDHAPCEGLISSFKT